MSKDLVRLNRRFLKEGVLTKVRLAHRQKRTVMLFNDMVIYASEGAHVPAMQRSCNGRVTAIYASEGAPPPWYRQQQQRWQWQRRRRRQ